MPSLADLLDGVSPAPLFGHLSTQPIVEPVSLANLVEASWPGYAFSPIQFIERVFMPGGWGVVQGVACFGVDNGELPTPIVTAFYVTAEADDVYLIWVANLIGSTYAHLAYGANYYKFSINSYVTPAGP